MLNLDTLRDDITNTFLNNKQYETIIIKDEYTNFSYPGRFLPLMKFNTKLYKILGFGHCMSMNTKSFFGMKLLTLSFMPGEGVSIPYLLIDIMTMGKKRTIFVEYYDCTVDHIEMKHLEEVSQAYKDIPKYEEKPNWYVNERTPYSLIKMGTATDDEKLKNMIMDSLQAYNKELSSLSINKKNLQNLMAFRNRMIHEGNPSTSILKKVFGNEGFEKFYTDCIMPM